MKAKELREKTDEELRQELDKLREGLFKLRFRKVTDVVENPSEFRRLRRDRARVLTLLRERQLRRAEGSAAPAK